MARKLKFDLSVESAAKFCPNPTEWFIKSYITENVNNNFRTIPGVKGETEVSFNTMSNILKAAGCNWNAVDTGLDAELVSVCKLDAMVQVCQYSLEDSFVAGRMTMGDANWQEADFLTHFWDELAREIEEEIQLLRWNGDTGTGAHSSSSFLSECDGYLSQLAGSDAQEWVTYGSDFNSTEINSTNIVEILEGVIGELPEAVLGNFGDVRIYMSAKNAYHYQVATLGKNSDFNYTGTLPLSFAGYTIAVQPGMNDDYIVAGNKNSFAYAFDGIDDDKNIKIVDMSETTAEPTLRARVALKLGFKILNGGKEVAYFVASQASS